MRLLLLLAWRQLGFRPARTLLSALGIALGLATVVAVLVVDHNTLLSQQARRNPDDPGADLLIQPLERKASAVGEAETELRTQPFLRGVTAFATARRTLVGPAPTDAPGARPPQVPDVEVMALQGAASSYHQAYTVQSGVDLDAAGDSPQMLVSAALAERLALKPGDEVALFAPIARRGPTTKCVDGEMVAVPAPRRAPSGQPEQHIFQVVGVLAPTRLGFDKSRVLIGFAQGQELFGEELEASFWADLDRDRSNFLAAEAALRGSFTVFEPKRALAGLAPEEAAFRSGVRICGFLALFLGLYIIFNTMSMSLVERVRQIALLRALGLTRARLFLVFLVEGLALALLGTALAALLARWIVQGMVAMRITTLGFGKPLEIVDIPWSPILAVVAAGIGFALVGIVYPFLRASGLSVIDALRRGVIALSDDPFTGTRRTILVGLLLIVPLAWFIGAPADGALAEPLWKAFVQAAGVVTVALAVPLLLPRFLPELGRGLLAPLRGPTATLARATLSSARHRVFATVTGLMLVFAAVFVVVSVLESLKGDTRSFTAHALDGRLFLKTTPDGAEKLPELMRRVPALAGLQPFNVEIRNPFLIRAVDETRVSSGPLAADAALRKSFAETPSLVLSSACAEDFGYIVGNRIRLATASSGAVDFEVLAISDGYGFVPDDRAFALISAGNMKRYWCKDATGLGNWFVQSAAGLPPGDLSELREQVGAVIGADNVFAFQRGEEIGAEYLAGLDRDFEIFYAILLLTVALAGLGMLNAMVIAVMERRREIGLLRTVGLTGGQVANMLFLESGAFGVLGGLLGLLVGWPLAVAAVHALATSSRLNLDFEWTLRAVAGVGGGAIFVVLLAVLYPALRANRMKLAEVVRYE
jgi:putative ABC transport system permease protein